MINTKNLSVGILLDTTSVCNWEYELISRLKSLDFIDLKVVVLNGIYEKNSNNLLKKIYNKVFSLTLTKIARVMFNYLDMHSKSWVNPFKKRNAEPLIDGIKKLIFEPVQHKYFDYFNAKDVSSLQNENLDVLIRLGFRILKGDILKVVRHGIWSLHHGDNRVNRGGPAGFWEFYYNWPYTGSILQVLKNELDGGIVLYRSKSSTDSYSLIRSRSKVYWKSLLFITRKLSRLHASPSKFYEELSLFNNPSVYSNRLFKSPTFYHWVYVLFRGVYRKVKKSLKSIIFIERWELMVSKNNEFSGQLYKFITLKSKHNSRNLDWADPIVVYENNSHHIFFEEYSHASKKGYISLITYSNTDGFSEPEKILEREYHLSYPSIFKFDDTYYMIPETSQNNSIELYKCESFPDKWVFFDYLMKDIYAVDPTIYFDGIKWWMFANIRELEGMSQNDELFLFHSDNPINKSWVPHNNNPIVSDVSNARPAGSILSIDGKNFRPAQNCSKHYGYGFNLNLIKALNHEEYIEESTFHTLPCWSPNIIGTHTIAYCNGLTVIDCLRTKFRWS